MNIIVKIMTWLGNLLHWNIPSDMPSNDSLELPLPDIPIPVVKPLETANTGQSEPSIVPIFPLMIVKWATSIAIWEGAKPESHNPGNLKYGSLTASWGATKGRVALDGGFFCQFATEQQGHNALCNFLILGCEDQLKSFHKARTLETFMNIYAGNPPKGYINGIVKMMDVPPYVDIETFLG